MFEEFLLVAFKVIRCSGLLKQMRPWTVALRIRQVVGVAVAGALVSPKLGWSQTKTPKSGLAQAEPGLRLKSNLVSGLKSSGAR